MKGFCSYFMILIPLTWFGMLAGISFIETPLKFSAPGITLPLGLGIGRLVFGTLNRIELVMSVLLYALYLLSGRSRSSYLLVHLTVLCVTVQTFLLPLLDQQAAAIITGTGGASSGTHSWYILLEVCKIVFLLSEGVFNIKSYAQNIQSIDYAKKSII